MIEAQSRESDADRRKQILWEIERKLAADNARSIIFYNRTGTANNPTSRVSPSWPTAFSMAGGWKMCGSTGDPQSIWR